MYAVFIAVVQAIIALRYWFFGRTVVQESNDNAFVFQQRWGRPHGILRLYHGDALVLESEYLFGRPHGRSIVYLPGARHIETHYYWGDRYGPEKHYTNGRLRSVDCPGQFYQSWYSNGRPRHWFVTEYESTDHTTTPILKETEWRRNGSVRKIIYTKNSRCHRIGAPAAVFYTRGRTQEYWMVNGRPHRTDGPAIAGTREEYYAHGWHFTREEFTARMFKDHAEALFALLPQPIAEEIWTCW